MAGKMSSATERAIERVSKGETPYSVAKSEGIALSTIYRALRKPEDDARNYAYDIGAVVGEIEQEHKGKITVATLGNLSTSPHLVMGLLRHIDLSRFDIPQKPENWKPSAQESTQFWLGYYHSRKLS